MDALKTPTGDASQLQKSQLSNQSKPQSSRGDENRLKVQSQLEPALKPNSILSQNALNKDRGTASDTQSRGRASAAGGDMSQGEDISPLPSARKSVRIKPNNSAEGVSEDDIIDALDAQLDQLKETFQKLENVESQKILLANLSPLMVQVGQILFQSQLKEIVLDRELIRAALEKRLKKQSEEEGGFRFHEFYDELRAISIAIVNKPPAESVNVTKRKSQDSMLDQSHVFNDSILVTPEEEKQIVEIGYANSQEHAKELAVQWLKKNPEFEWRGVWKTTVPNKMSVIEVYKVAQIDTQNLTPSQINLLKNVETIMHTIKDNIEKAMQDSKNVSSADIVKQLIDLLPVRIIKLQNLNQDDSFADQMKSLQSMKSQQFKNAMKSILIDQISKFLDRNRTSIGAEGVQKNVNFEMILHSVKQALVFTSEDEYELQKRDEHEDLQQAELVGLDDFLLMNQDEEDPTLLEQLEDTIKSYQTLIDERKFKDEAERDKILNLLRTLHKQVDLVKRRGIKKEISNIMHFNTKKYSPNPSRQQMSQIGYSMESLGRVRERNLKDIFDFYCRQQLQNQKSATFEAIGKDYYTLNLGKLVRFCIDFRVPLPKLSVTSVFKRVTTNSHDITYDQFKDTIEKLFVEINKTRARDLKKKVKNGQKNGVSAEQIHEANRQMNIIKAKTRDDIVEEAYKYLEIDNINKVEQKKKGVTMNFLNEGDPLFKNYAPVDISMMPPIKAKLRNFTEEEKEEIKNQVKQIKIEREMYLSQNPGSRFFSTKRPMIGSRGTLLNTDSQSQLDGTSFNKSTNSPQNKNPLNTKHILTLQKLASITNYKELNSKADDDFNPEQFGFDPNPPVPGKILQLIPEEDAETNYLGQTDKVALNLPNAMNSQPPASKLEIKQEQDAQNMRVNKMMTLPNNRSNILAVDHQNSYELVPYNHKKGSDVVQSSHSVNLAQIKKQYQPPLLPQAVQHQAILSQNRSKILLNKSPDPIIMKAGGNMAKPVPKVQVFKNPEVKQNAIVEVWKNPLYDGDATQSEPSKRWQVPNIKSGGGALTQHGTLIPMKGAPVVGNPGKFDQLSANLKKNNNNTNFNNMSPIRNYTDILNSKSYKGVGAVGGKHSSKPSISHSNQDKQLELPPIPTPYSMGNPASNGYLQHSFVTKSKRNQQ